MSIALFATWQKDIRNHKDWYGRNYRAETKLVITISEPLLSKAKSYKAVAFIDAVIENDTAYPACGKIILYFSKSDTNAVFSYGDKLIINKFIQPVKNTGTPGAFDYERYAAFQQIFHTVYLKPGDYVDLKKNKKNFFDDGIYATKDYIIRSIKKYLPPDKNISGIAEALLIGYKEDLDKGIVQAYSNTGVVHIIAISGLHLGLIYVMLAWISGLIPFIKKRPLPQVILILTCLWLFSLLTGASASVLRSAVMFTCIVIGKKYFKQASIYNSLAASAFLLLCFNPYFLWDVGFQLSYLAIYGIVWLQKPLYHFLYIKNKAIRTVWQMTSVTIAAQVISFPICIYYFHQFPNLFLITNLVAVPLSTVILFAEILLIVFSYWPFAAVAIGKVVYWLIWLMNYIIALCDNVPYSQVKNIVATEVTTVLLYLLVFSVCCWLLYKKRLLFKIALANLILFTGAQAFQRIRLQRQQKIIIYNVPGHKAMDFISSGNYHFIGDSILQSGEMENLYLKPARIGLKPANKLISQSLVNNSFHLGTKKIMIADSSFDLKLIKTEINVDILVISNNPQFDIREIINAARPSVVVFDGSNSLWKIAQWKTQCEQLLLPCFSVSEQGAYILDIPD